MGKGRKVTKHCVFFPKFCGSRSRGLKSKLAKTASVAGRETHLVSDHFGSSDLERVHVVMVGMGVHDLKIVSAKCNYNN